MAWKKEKKPLSLKQFLINYLTYHEPLEPYHKISVLDSEFHDMVGEKYPNLKRKLYMFGCMPIPAVMRCLEKLYKEGRVLRFRSGIPSGNWEPGFPKWVYTYYMQEDCRVKANSNLRKILTGEE